MLEIALLALLGLSALVYLYFSYIYNYWGRKGLPQPPTVLGFGNLFDVVLMRNNIGLIYDQIYRSYPEHDAVGVYGMLTPQLLLRSPALIQRVLVSDFSSFHDNVFTVSKKLDPYFYEDPFILNGQEWKVNRTKLTATLTSSRLKEIFPLMKDILPRLDGYLHDHLGKDISAKELATLFTMDNVSNTVFGINSNCFSDPNAAFRKLSDLQMQEIHSWWSNMVRSLMPALQDLLRLRVVPVAVSEYIERVVQEVMEYRQKNNVKRNDLFHQFVKKDSGKDFNEVMFYAMTFFLEGFETSAMVASATLYELALNPEIQEVLYLEVAGALGGKGDIDYDTINNNLPYLDKVLQEAMRKYPIMFAFVRECTKPATLDVNGKPVDIEVGTPVIVPMFSIHRDPLYYPDPDVFDPERFSEEAKTARPPCTYMPFGDGPRICPGSRFGLQQIKLLISHLIHKYKILRSDNTPEKLTFSVGSFLVAPNEEEWIRIEKRR